jgi:site-specific DNA-methyltransferase (adenine-specific)
VHDRRRAEARQHAAARFQDVRMHGDANERLAQVHSDIKSPAAKFPLDRKNCGDGIELLRATPDAFTPLVFFDPQFRENLDRLGFGNEGVDRQRARALLSQMPTKMIRAFGTEIARTLVPNGYLLRWTDKYSVAEGLIAAKARAIGLKLVEVIVWDTGRSGQGWRGFQRGQYLAAMQKPPCKTRKSKGVAPVWAGLPSIRDVWPERVPEHRYHPEVHPHAKPFGLISALIEAMSSPGDTIVDPCAGGFVVMDAALAAGRRFLARLHQLRGLGDAKVLKSLGRSPKGRHYKG